MRNYNQARGLATERARLPIRSRGKNAIIFHDYFDGSVAARMYDTDVVTWDPDGEIVITHGGWVTMTTCDAIRTALGENDVTGFGHGKTIPKVLGQEFDERDEIRTSAEVWYEDGAPAYV